MPPHSLQSGMPLDRSKGHTRLAGSPWMRCVLQRRTWVDSGGLFWCGMGGHGGSCSQHVGLLAITTGVPARRSLAAKAPGKTAASCTRSPAMALYRNSTQLDPDWQDVIARTQQVGALPSSAIPPVRACLS